MKLLTILLVLTSTISNRADDSNEIERNERYGDWIGDLINGTINEILNNMTDPIILEDIKTVSFRAPKIIEGDFNVTNITIAGIKNLVATKIDAKLLLLSLNMTVQIPKLTLAFDYFLDIALINYIPLYGQGLNTIEISDINVDITGKLNATKGTKVQDVTVLITLGSGKFDIEGLFNNPIVYNYLNEQLDQYFVEIFNQLNQVISVIIGTIAEIIINNLLQSGIGYQEFSEYNKYYNNEGII